MITLETIYKLLRHCGITSIPRIVLQDYIDSVYTYLLDNNERSSAESYLKGKIEAQLKFGIIKSDPIEQ